MATGAAARVPATAGPAAAMATGSRAAIAASRSPLLPPPRSLGFVTVHRRAHPAAGARVPASARAAAAMAMGKVTGAARAPLLPPPRALGFGAVHPLAHSALRSGVLGWICSADRGGMQELDRLAERKRRDGRASLIKVHGNGNHVVNSPDYTSEVTVPFVSKIPEGAPFPHKIHAGHLFIAAFVCFVCQYLLGDPEESGEQKSVTNKGTVKLELRRISLLAIVLGVIFHFWSPMTTDEMIKLVASECSKEILKAAVKAILEMFKGF